MVVAEQGLWMSFQKAGLNAWTVGMRRSMHPSLDGRFRRADGNGSRRWKIQHLTCNSLCPLPKGGWESGKREALHDGRYLLWRLVPFSQVNVGTNAMRLKGYLVDGENVEVFGKALVDTVVSSQWTDNLSGQAPSRCDGHGVIEWRDSMRHRHRCISTVAKNIPTHDLYHVQAWTSSREETRHTLAENHASLRR